MAKYLVQLLYPDYMTDDYGVEHYANWVEAETPEEAVESVQSEVWLEYGGDGGVLKDATDMQVFAVLVNGDDGSPSYV